MAKKTNKATAEAPTEVKSDVVKATQGTAAETEIAQESSESEAAETTTEVVQESAESGADGNATDPKDEISVSHNEKAAELMKQNNVSEIWRCPATGYWFTKKENAGDNSRRVKKDPEHYKL